MIHSLDTVLDWLRYHCKHDRVLYNALINHKHPPSIHPINGKWMIDATKSTTGDDLFVAVVPHPVTGEPDHYYRTGDRQCDADGT